jgi:hypothetical protein
MSISGEKDSKEFLKKIIKIISFDDKSVNYDYIDKFIRLNFCNKNKKAKKHEHIIEDFIRMLLIYTKKPLNENMILYLLSRSSFLKRLDNCCNLYEVLDYAHAKSIIFTICSLVIYTRHYRVSYNIYKLIFYCINIINLIFDSQNKELSVECKLCIDILHKDDKACLDLTKHISSFYDVKKYIDIVNSFVSKFINNIHFVSN